jgi:hypothetical protein
MCDSILDGRISALDRAASQEKFNFDRARGAPADMTAGTARYKAAQWKHVERIV